MEILIKKKWEKEKRREKDRRRGKKREKNIMES